MRPRRDALRAPRVRRRPILAGRRRAGGAASARSGAGGARRDDHLPRPRATVGLGFTWGASTLEFQGQTYPVRVDGFVLGAVGTSSIEGVGEVFGLTKAEDLNGDFTAVVSGVAHRPGHGGAGDAQRQGRAHRDRRNRQRRDPVGLGLRGIHARGRRGRRTAGRRERSPSADARLRGGERRARLSRPTFNLSMYFAVPDNAGFDGDWSFGPVDEVDAYFEHSSELGLNARYPLGPEREYGTLRARVQRRVLAHRERTRRARVQQRSSPATNTRWRAPISPGNPAASSRSSARMPSSSAAATRTTRSSTVCSSGTAARTAPAAARTGSPRARRSARRESCDSSLRTSRSKASTSSTTISPTPIPGSEPPGSNT